MKRITCDRFILSEDEQIRKKAWRYVNEN